MGAGCARSSAALDSAAPPRKRWTFEEVHALPEDGNTYELVYGEPWVTPTPRPARDDPGSPQGIPECWIVDGDARTITIVKPARDPEPVTDRLAWSPAGAREPLTLDLTRAFD